LEYKNSSIIVYLKYILRVATPREYIPLKTVIYENSNALMGFYC